MASEPGVIKKLDEVKAARQMIHNREAQILALVKSCDATEKGQFLNDISVKGGG